MAERDLYTLWLGLPPGPRPPDPYTLLGLDAGCADPAAIDSAAHRQLDKLDRYSLTGDAAKRAECQRIMNEVGRARSNLIAACAAAPADPPRPVLPLNPRTNGWRNAIAIGATVLIALGIAGVYLALQSDKPGPRIEARQNPQIPEKEVPTPGASLPRKDIPAAPKPVSPAPAAPKDVPAPPKNGEPAAPIAPAQPAPASPGIELFPQGELGGGTPAAPVPPTAPGISPAPGAPTTPVAPRPEQPATLVPQPPQPPRPAPTIPNPEAPKRPPRQPAPSPVTGPPPNPGMAKVIRSIDLELGSLPSLIKLREPNQLVAVGKDRFMTIEGVAMEPRGKPMVFKDDAITEVALDSGSDDHIATISVKGDSLRVWKTKTGEQVGPTISRPNMVSAALGFDGLRVVVCDATRPDKGSHGAVAIYDVAKGKQIGKDLKVEGGAKAVVVSPDGRMILTLARDGTSRTWDANSGDPVSPPIEDKSTVAADFAPTGACVASLGQEIKVWDASNGEMQWTAKPAFSASRLAFSPLGSRLVIGGSIREDGMSCTAIQVFDTATGKPLTDVLRHDASAGTFGPSVGFGFNSDETRLVTHGSHGRSARVWDLRDDGRLLFEPLEHPRTVVSAAFLDPAGNTLVTASGDGLLRSWELIPTPKPDGKSPEGPAKGTSGLPAHSTVFLIDTTGSMSNSLKQMQDEVRRQIDLLPQESAINIVTFGEEPKFFSEWPVLIGKIGKTEVKDFVSSLSVPSGYSGARNDHFAETFKRVLKMRPSDIWVMTDGDLVNARKRFTEAGEDANRAKVFLNTMLITAPARDELLAGADAVEARLAVWDLARVGTGFGHPPGVTVDESGKPLEHPPKPRQLPAARREPRDAVYKPGKSVVYIIDRTARLYLTNNLIPQEMARQLALLPKDAKVNIIVSGGKELLLLSDKLQTISPDVRSGFRDLVGARISDELATNVDEAIKAAIDMKPEEIVVFSTGLPMKPTRLLTDLQPLVKQSGVRIIAVHSHYPLRNSKPMDDRLRPSSTPLWTLALESGGACIVPRTGQVIKDPIAPPEPDAKATAAP